MSNSTQGFYQSLHPDRRPPFRGLAKYTLRFSKLDGGQFGEVTFTATSPMKLEMQMGDDFVRFTREQVGELVHALQHFLAIAQDDSEVIGQED